MRRTGSSYEQPRLAAIAISRISSTLGICEIICGRYPGGTAPPTPEALEGTRRTGVCARLAEKVGFSNARYPPRPCAFKETRKADVLGSFAINLSSAFIAHPSRGDGSDVNGCWAAATGVLRGSLILATPLPVRFSARRNYLDVAHSISISLTLRPKSSTV